MTSHPELRPFGRVRARIRGEELPPSQRLSIRAVTKAFAIGFGVISFVVIVALVWTADLLQRATDDAIRDTTSMAIANEIELRLLGYQRLSVFYSPEEFALREERDEVSALLDELLGQARRYASDPQEHAILSAIIADIAAYRTEREELEARGLPNRAIDLEVREELERAIESVEELRGLNQVAVQEAQAEALRVDRLTNVAAAAAGTMLFLGLVIVVLGVRRYVVYPVLELQAAIRAFRTGKPGVRAPGHGSRELGELSETFNEMTDAIERQREARLTFMAGVVHDLRNPLSALSMALEVAKTDTSEENRSRVLRMVDRQIGRLSRMVDDLFESTRIEAGKLALQRRPTDLREIVREIIDFYAPSAPNHQLVADVPDEPVCVDADPLRIEQVTSNLVSNAVKYSPEGGRVEVVLRPVGDEAVLEVRDQGVGIPPDRIEELFTPFRRLAAEVAPGAGLGLSVVRRIVEAHGGRIEVESVVHGGSTFRVRLPLRVGGVEGRVSGES